MHANGDIERGYPPVLPLASRGALVGATPLLVTGTDKKRAVWRTIRASEVDWAFLLTVKRDTQKERTVDY